MANKTSDAERGQTVTFVRLKALHLAGVRCEESGPLRYSVGPGYSYWPSTDRWRSTSNRHVSGYGIRHLIEAVRERG